MTLRVRELLAKVSRRTGPGPRVFHFFTKTYVALAFANYEPKPVKELARSDGAAFVRIQSKYDGVIPSDADWLRIARELNTVLLNLLDGDCSELHLFPAVPIPLAFAIGMGLDTRRQVVVHQWYSTENKYCEVFHLNKLGAAACR